MEIMIKPTMTVREKYNRNVLCVKERNSHQSHFSNLDSPKIGSIRSDIPISGLAEMLNCQFFIVSQCNPHIVPFFFNPKGGVGRPSRWSSGEQEHSWRGGFLLAALEMYLKVCAKVSLLLTD